MKAVVVPALSSSWQIKDVRQPQPGPGQVLVKMRASGIYPTDVHQTLGHLPGSFPRILGPVSPPNGIWTRISPGFLTASRRAALWRNTDTASSYGRCFLLMARTHPLSPQIPLR